MHIVLVGDYPREPNRIDGGVEAVVFYLAQALKHDRDVRVSVVTLERWGRGQHVAEYEGIVVHYLRKSKLPTRLSLSDNIQRMRRQIVKLQPDLVHAHGTTEYAFAAAKSGAPWVLTLHGMRHQEAALLKGLVNRYRTWLVKWDERSIVRRAPHVISISPHVRNIFGNYIRHQLYAIENPIADLFFEARLPHGASPPADRILYVGRLNARKDIMNLLHAFTLVRQQRPDAHLLLAGDGNINGEPSPYYLELRRFVAENNLDAVVKFSGTLDDCALVKEYAACSVVVLSSRVETAPMAIAQAMAAGKPVVSTDAGGCRYLVEDGETGYIVPIADSRALADALVRVLDDEDAAAEMGERARLLAEQRFRASVVAAQTREVYAIATAGH